MIHDISPCYFAQTRQKPKGIIQWAGNQQICIEVKEEFSKLSAIKLVWWEECVASKHICRSGGLGTTEHGARASTAQGNREHRQGHNTVAGTRRTQTRAHVLPPAPVKHDQEDGRR